MEGWEREAHAQGGWVKGERGQDRWGKKDEAVMQGAQRRTVPCLSWVQVRSISYLHREFAYL